MKITDAQYNVFAKPILDRWKSVEYRHSIKTRSARFKAFQIGAWSTKYADWLRAYGIDPETVIDASETIMRRDDDIIEHSVTIECAKRFPFRSKWRRWRVVIDDITLPKI
jgi:hypothetical protein